MIVTRLEIKNYKSFWNPEPIHFGPGFNVVIGPNSGGKSSLIEALTLGFAHKPHRSTTSSPSRTSPNSLPSEVKIAAQISREDIAEKMRAMGLMHLGYAWSVHDTAADTPVHQLNHLLNTSGINLEVIVRQPNGIEYQSDPITAALIGEQRGGTMAWNAEMKNFESPQPHLTSHGGYNLSMLAYPIIQPQIYAFQAERLKIGKNPVGTQTELMPDAQNLPVVIHNLRSNPDRYELYISLVRSVLPEVQYVTVPYTHENLLEIRVWNEPTSTQRDDLAVSLTDCGTGVSQVLALLYVIVTSEQPRTLVIDEPQSFLNPGALRKLLEILQAHPQHQYILATHSPTLLSALELSSLTLVKRQGTESTITTLDPSSPRALKIALNEVGAQISDVYGADRVLWVEGPTEEACFPKIARRFNIRLEGCVIVGVQQTGDFETKKQKGQKAQMAFDVYGKLSLPKPLLPPALAFVFDRERRTKSDLKELQSKGEHVGVPVMFLERLLYENYLLDSDAITHVINLHDAEREKEVLVTEILAWVETNRWEEVYFDRAIPENQRTEERWLKEVHGAKLLEDIFKKFTEARVEYRKTDYSVELTAWLLENKPTEFEDLQRLLERILKMQVNPNEEDAAV